MKTNLKKIKDCRHEISIELDSQVGATLLATFALPSAGVILLNAPGAPGWVVKLHQVPPSASSVPARFTARACQ